MYVPPWGPSAQSYGNWYQQPDAQALYYQQQVGWRHAGVPQQLAQQQQFMQQQQQLAQHQHHHQQHQQQWRQPPAPVQPQQQPQQQRQSHGRPGQHKAPPQAMAQQPQTGTLQDQQQQQQHRQRAEEPAMSAHPPQPPAPQQRRQEEQLDELQQASHHIARAGHGRGVGSPRKRPRRDDGEVAEEKEQRDTPKKNRGGQGGKGGLFGNKRNKLDDLPPLAPRYLAAMKVGTSPQEVAKWREERRKNYPTRANLERRAAEGWQPPPPEPEQGAAGEGPRQDTGEGQGEEHVEEQGEEADEQVGTDSGTGTGQGAGTGAGPSAVDGPRARRPCFRFLKGNCRYGSRCHFEHSQESRTNSKVKQRKEAEKRQFLAATARSGGTPSLLRKLLAGDIRKERAVVLQCIHHLLLLKAREQLASGA